MTIKFTIVMTLLVLSLGDTSVNKSDQCTSCTQMKSQDDCKLYGGCTWIGNSTSAYGSCITTQITTTQVIQFCTTLKEPSTTCAKQYGCAYLESKCTHFAGCSAYIKTSTLECQTISYRCISDGATCTDAQDCASYSQAQCDQTPGIKGRKCKWDSSTTICRDYNCSEADVSLKTDRECDSFSIGCITTGVGCVASPLPECSAFTGTESTCLLMTGKDGKCEFNAGTTNCKRKVCSGAPKILAEDSDCNQYQVGCITTGKGCIETRGICSSYSVVNPVTDCVRYIGTDGVCEGDEGQTTCRSRKCENGTGITDELCDNYKKGCVSSGNGCISAKSSCSGYTGTLLTCLDYIGTDGNCKGTSITVTSCAPKDCEVDSLDIYTTDSLCQKNIQSTCYSTGKGCVKTLLSCSTYIYTSSNGAECNTRIGSEGKCKAGTSGKCASRICSEAPTTLTTNKECENYFKGCATTGAGCVSQITCINTLNQLTCEGSQENSVNCSWNSSCIPNTSCSNFTTMALCSTLKAVSGSSSTPCIWENLICRDAKCIDFTGRDYMDDIPCNLKLTGCVTNGVGCADPNICSQFFGNKTACEQFKAFCTNVSDAVGSTTPCIKRTCDDLVNYTTDADCMKYYQECLTKGTGCIRNTALCQNYSGTWTECQNFKGYLTSNSRAKCWNTNISGSSSCVTKACIHATGMTSNSDCNAFLIGCLFDGNNSCVDPSAGCSSYKYTDDETLCQNFKGVNGTRPCYQDSSNKCKDRTCSDKTVALSNSECNIFLEGCIKSGAGCISTVTCTLEQGTTNQCNQYFGNSSPCTKVCKQRTCSDKIDAANYNDCTNYHSKCRLVQGGTTCIEAPLECEGFTFSENTTENKMLYCYSISTNKAQYCSYDPKTPNNCVPRKCSLWSSTLQTSCGNYVGETCMSTGIDINYCYSPDVCGSYLIPNTVSSDADKLTWCNNLPDNGNNAACTYNASVSKSYCKSITECEEILNPSDDWSCNDFLGTGRCLMYDSKCYTTLTDCTKYSLVGIAEDSKADYCSQHTGDNNGNVKLCSYSANTPTHCVDITKCSDVYPVYSQEICDARLSGCNYYYYSCYSKISCALQNVSDDIGDNPTKRLFCQNMIDSDGHYCTYTYDSATCATGISCNEIFGENVNSDLCNTFRDKTGPICILDVNKAGYCTISQISDGSICTTVKIVDNDNDSDIRTTVGLCQRIDGAWTLKKISCSEYAASGSSDDEKALNCQQLRDKNGNHCSWFTSGSSNCEISKPSCQDWNGLISTANSFNSIYCWNRIDKEGIQCTYNLGATSCRTHLYCENESYINNQVDCDEGSPGCTYSIGFCHKTNDNCGVFNAEDPDEEGNAGSLWYCNSLKNSRNGQCTYLYGYYQCINKGPCNSYDISDLDNFTQKYNACKNALHDNSARCTYWGGNTCQDVTACSTYTNGNASTISTDCGRQYFYENGVYYKCLGSGTACYSPANCEAIQNPTNLAFCNLYLPNCLFYSSKCYTKNSNCSYTTPGSEAIAFCNGLINTNLDNCTATSDSATTCRNKTCNDPQPSNFVFSHTNCNNYLSTCKYNGIKCVDYSLECFEQSPDTQDCTLAWDSNKQIACAAVVADQQTCHDKTCDLNTKSTTDADCETFMSGCVTKGVGCISNTSPCSSYTGTISVCNKYTGNKIQCRGVSDTISSPCKNMECTENSIATTDVDCEAFMTGCATKGVGCISNTAPCSSYSGTISTCKSFSRNNLYCWGNSDTISGPCKNKECQDNKTATTDADCNSFLAGCLTRGMGCYNKSLPCQAFTGTQDTCKNLKGNNFTIPCWNTSTANNTSPCRNRQCSDFLGTNDLDCQAFLPAVQGESPKCVTDGTGCVSYPRNCSEFKGTEKTCPKFAAADGPCKTTTYTATPANCTPRICTEASNSLTTDAQCQEYHSSCKTTGKGCMNASIGCANIQTSAACGAKNDCLWASQCRVQPTLCNSLTTQGQSTCVNTILANGSKCAWGNNVCRSLTCADYDVELTTHDQCNNIDITCTTNGAGCVTLGSCSSYLTPSVCNAANTTEITGTCTWDKIAGACRMKQCKDFSGKTDIDCQAFLSGCKTSGSNCIGPVYDCSDFTGNQKYCLQDSSLNPCLYLDGVCYNYAGCSDVSSSTLSGCQAFNSLCVPSSSTCIAKKACDKYADQQSCTIGINNSICGWLPIGKCQIYNACSDAAGTLTSDCQNYGKNCVTDGTKCIEIGKCSSYLTNSACNNEGLDGMCIWDAKLSNCRVRQCSDLIATTDSDCAAFIVPTGVCTTDKTKCISRAACSSYSTEVTCTIGIDGIPCIFALPINSTSGIKSCRAKECEDIVGTSNEKCIGQISGKKCVSNGTICVKQDTCANFKNKISCNAGGSDGICTFTSAATKADSLAGSCQAFTSCDKANNDQAACNSKSAACTWSSIPSGTTTKTSCSDKTCIQAATGTDCNPIPNFDGSKYTICALENNVCTAVDPSTLSSTLCYTKSQYTYSWSESSQKCQGCKASNSTNNSNNATNTTNLNNSADITTTDQGFILGITILSLILEMF